MLTENANIDYFRRKLGLVFDVDSIGAPGKFGDYYIWNERKADQEHEVIYARKSLDGEPRALLDINKLNQAEPTSLDYYYVSQDGKLMAYGLSRNGDEMATLFVLDIESGKNLPDQIPHARYTYIAWLPDNSSFFYTRCDIGENEPKIMANQHLYFHPLGGEAQNDQMIFGEGRPKDDIINMRISLNGAYLVISATQQWTRNDLFLYSRTSGRLSTIVEGIDAQFSALPGKDYLYVKTNHGAPNYRVIRAPLSSLPENVDEWEEVIAETSDVLNGIWLSKDKLFALYLHDAVDRVKVHDWGGKFVEDLPLPEMPSFTGITAKEYEAEYFYGAATFTHPKIIYRYDPHKNKYSEYRRAETKFDGDQFVAKQEWATSKDGTKLPIFIVHRKDLKLNGQNPTVLYGYGGFGSSEGPLYISIWMPWLEAGGIFVDAVIRGGGEYGEDWHKAGIKEKKQNSFDDFIAVAEYLILAGYTSPEHLGIQGGSNGGLLVGVAMAHRPALFKAVLCQVPLLDMTRFHKFLIAGRWVHEYGDPEKPDELERILQWSPYHNVKQGVHYPAVFFATADHDTRVAPLHARKMAAKMQELDPNNLILVRTAIQQGHTGSGRSKQQIIIDRAERFAFMAWQLGLKV